MQVGVAECRHLVSTVVQRPVCYPLELHRPGGVNVCCWTASGQQVKDLETRRLMGSISGEFARDSEHQQLH